jgi:hypothetical protein
MEPDENEEYAWKTLIPAQSTTCYLYYWIMATDNQGNTTTSQAYELKIEDLEQVYLLSNLAFWVPISITVLGMSLIFAFAWILKRRALKKSADKFHVIGSEEVSHYGSDNEGDALWRKKQKWVRAVVFIILVAITITFIIWSLMENLYGEVVYFVEGGL